MSEKKLNDVTKAGAVELEESKLDEVAGGLNFAKIEVDRIASRPTYDAALKIKFTDLM